MVKPVKWKTVLASIQEQEDEDKMKACKDSTAIIYNTTTRGHNLRECRTH